MESYYSKIDFKVEHIWVKDVFNEIKYNRALISNIEEDIQNYSSTVMFRGTPCNSFFPVIDQMKEGLLKLLRQSL